MRDPKDTDTMTKAKLPKETIREHYNKLGERQNRQKIYAKPAFDSLLQYGAFESAEHILEIGCGTGDLALRLFKEKLSDKTFYTGFDISTTMIDITQTTLKPFAPRVTLIEGDATETLPFENGAFDRVIITYVFDIFSNEESENTLKDIHRILRPGGLLTIATIASTSSGISGALSKLWSKVYNLNPKVVGGCQPVDISPHLDEADWTIQLEEIVSAYGIPSKTIVAKRL